MATIEDHCRAVPARLRRFEPEPEMWKPGEQYQRSIYLTRRGSDFMDAPPDLGHGEYIRSIDLLRGAMVGFVSGTAKDALKRHSSPAIGLWEFKVAKLRLVGWLQTAQLFIGDVGFARSSRNHAWGRASDVERAVCDVRAVLELGDYYTGGLEGV